MTDKIDTPTIPHQASIRVKQNQAGIVILKQDGQYGPEEDQEIHVAPANALKLAKAILKEAGIEAAILPWKDVLIVNGGGEVLRPFPPDNEEFWLAIDDEKGGTRHAEFVRKSNRSPQLKSERKSDDRSAG